MSSPLESPNFKSLYLGNENDDDADVTRQYFTPAPDGPPNVAVEPIPSQAVIVPPVLHRMMTGFDNVDPAWAQPQVILPVDEFRIMLMIRAFSSTATDGGYWADNPNSLISPNGALAPKFGARILPADGWVNLGPYTGALAFTAFGAAGPVLFSWCAVTK